MPAVADSRFPTSNSASNSAPRSASRPSLSFPAIVPPRSGRGKGTTNTGRESKVSSSTPLRIGAAGAARARQTGDSSNPRQPLRPRASPGAIVPRSHPHLAARPGDPEARGAPPAGNRRLRGSSAPTPAPSAGPDPRRHRARSSRISRVTRWISSSVSPGVLPLGARLPLQMLPVGPKAPQPERSETVRRGLRLLVLPHWIQPDPGQPAPAPAPFRAPRAAPPGSAPLPHPHPPVGRLPVGRLPLRRLPGRNAADPFPAPRCPPTPAPQRRGARSS